MPGTECKREWRFLRWSGWLSWLLILLVTLAMLAVMLMRMTLVDGRIGKALDCRGCFDVAVLLRDWPVLALVLLLLLAGFACRRYALALLLRLAALVVMLLYATDYFTSVELSSRLVFHELPNYLADTDIVSQHLASTGFFGGYWILAVGLVCGLLMLVLTWPGSASFRSRGAVGLMLFCLVSGLAVEFWPKPRYVHNWIIQNVFQYNWHRGEMQPYSDDFIQATLEKDPVSPTCYSGQRLRDDLIILILESWSVYQSRFFGGLHDWTPRLDALAGQGLAFDNFHAAGFSTNEGLMGLLTGMEVLATGKRRTPYITTWGRQNTLPAIMGRHGYHSSFLTTGNLRFSRKDSWLQHLGFDHLEGHDHPAYDGWPRLHFSAAPDEALYQRAVRHLEELEQQLDRKPYVVVLENVSSHHPYRHPHTGSTAEADVFGYMDEAAAEFIARLQKKGFFDHGRLLVVSDHRAMVPVSPAEEQALGLGVMSRIPAFWLGRDVPSGRVSQPFHQADVLPTLEHWVADEQCRRQGLRDMLNAHISAPRCVYHVRGDLREEVNLFCPQGEGVILLAGDRTRFRKAAGLSRQQQEQALGWLNRYRIERDIHHESWLDQKGQEQP